MTNVLVTLTKRFGHLDLLAPTQKKIDTCLGERGCEQEGEEERRGGGGREGDRVLTIAMILIHHKVAASRVDVVFQFFFGRRRNIKSTSSPQQPEIGVDICAGRRWGTRTKFCVGVKAPATRGDKISAPISCWTLKVELTEAIFQSELGFSSLFPSWTSSKINNKRKLVKTEKKVKLCIVVDPSPPLVVLSFTKYSSTNLSLFSLLVFFSFSLS